MYQSHGTYLKMVPTEWAEMPARDGRPGRPAQKKERHFWVECLPGESRPKICSLDLDPGVLALKPFTPVLFDFEITEFDGKPKMKYANLRAKD